MCPAATANSIQRISRASATASAAFDVRLSARAMRRSHLPTPSGTNRIQRSNERSSRSGVRLTDGRRTGCDTTRRRSWAVGASLLVHCAAFIGVAYFGQVYVVWYLGLSIIGSLLTEPRNATRRVYRIVNARGDHGEAAPAVAPVGA